MSNNPDAYIYAALSDVAYIVTVTVYLIPKLKLRL